VSRASVASLYTLDMCALSLGYNLGSAGGRDSRRALDDQRALLRRRAWAAPGRRLVGWRQRRGGRCNVAKCGYSDTSLYYQFDNLRTCCYRAGARYIALGKSEEVNEGAS
jgi:hypothetical protein